MCKASQGEYGVDAGLIFSFPCRNENGKIVAQTGWKHNAFGEAKIKATLDELKSERDAVKDLGLIE